MTARQTLSVKSNPVQHHFVLWRTTATLALGVVLSACNIDLADDEKATDETSDDRFRTIVVDATSNTDFRGVNLITGETTTDLAGDNWHIALRRYNGVQLNGGVAGTGSVQATMAQAQAAFYDANDEPVAATFINATAEMYLADLLNASAEGLTFAAESITHAFGTWQSWGRYNHASGGYVEPRTDRYWVLKTTAGATVAVRLTGDDYLFYTRGDDTYEDPTIRFAVTSLAAGATSLDLAEEGDAILASIDGYVGSVYVDLDTGTVQNSAFAGWDVQYRVETSASAMGTGTMGRLVLNGGVSGAGGVQLQGYYSAEELTALNVTGPYAFGNKSDSAANPIADNAWFVYGIAGYGSGHALAPNFRVYIVDLDGNTETTNDRFAIQAINYYHPDSGSSGYITLRVKQLDS